MYKNIYKCNVKETEISASEGMAFSLKLSHKFTVAGLLVYRPPGYTRNWCMLLPDLLAPEILGATNFMLQGDLNIHLEDSTCDIGQTLIEDHRGVSLELMNEGPTHKAGHLLDPIFANIPSLKSRPAMTLVWSDHYAVPASICAGNEPANIRDRAQRSLRPWARLDSASLNNQLRKSWPRVEQGVETDQPIVDTWLREALNEVLPVKVSCQAR